MRHFLKLSIALFLLPFAVNTADAQSPAPASSATEGCLHRSVQDCVAWIRQSFKVAGADTFDDQLKIFDKTDINGKPLYKTAYLSGPVSMRAGEGIIGLGFSLDERRVVTKVSIGLNSDPSRARTEDEYQMTGV
jgi:hypothetical protein